MAASTANKWVAPLFEKGRRILLDETKPTTAPRSTGTQDWVGIAQAYRITCYHVELFEMHQILMQRHHLRGPQQRQAVVGHVPKSSICDPEKYQNGKICKIPSDFISWGYKLTQDRSGTCQEAQREAGDIPAPTSASPRRRLGIETGEE